MCSGQGTSLEFNPGWSGEIEKGRAGSIWGQTEASHLVNYLPLAYLPWYTYPWHTGQLERGKALHNPSPLRWSLGSSYAHPCSSLSSPSC